MYNHLYAYLVKFCILYSYQFGFRKGYSTYMALICLVEKLITALENGEYAIGIFIDFRKAFDTVDHKILLSKLYHYGIRDIAYKWFENYLSNRVQYVSFNGYKSECCNISCGVPQGSILGPVLFLIYVNDLACVSDKLFSILFADDTNMFATDKNIDDLVNTINSELKSVVQWLCANKCHLI